MKYIKHSRNIDASIILHADYWYQHCPNNMINALVNFLTTVCRNSYNRYQKIKRQDRLLRKYRKFMQKYGLVNLLNVGLANDNNNNNNNDNNNNGIPNQVINLSTHYLNRRVAKMLDLVVLQDASFGIAHTFTESLTKKIINKSDNVKQTCKEILTPIIVRDINILLKGFKNDPQRMIHEAFNYKIHNISVRKAQFCRNAVKYM